MTGSTNHSQSSCSHSWVYSQCSFFRFSVVICQLFWLCYFLNYNFAGNWDPSSPHFDILDCRVCVVVMLVCISSFVQGLLVFQVCAGTQRILLYLWCFLWFLEPLLTLTSGDFWRFDLDLVGARFHNCRLIAIYLKTSVEI